MILRLLYARLLSLMAERARKDSELMAKIWYNRLLVGSAVFNAVPDKYRDACIQFGRDDVAAGKMTEEEFEMIFKMPFEG